MRKRDNSVGLFVAGVALGQVTTDSACATCRCPLGMQGAETCRSGEGEGLTYPQDKLYRSASRTLRSEKKARRENLG